MQTCFFAISNIIPTRAGHRKIKDAIVKTYGKKGETVVKMNFDSVDKTLDNLFEVKVPDKVTSKRVYSRLFRIMRLILLRRLLQR
jgi:pyruvate-ferredoxin/flavodoxin oxidoreductase